jgi:hypothetical protein
LRQIAAQSGGFGTIPSVESQNWQVGNGPARGLGATIAKSGLDHEGFRSRNIFVDWDKNHNLALLFIINLQKAIDASE